MERSPESDLQNRIHNLTDMLSNRDAKGHRRARQALIHMDGAAVPALIPLLSDYDAHTRWEAAKALGEIHDPRSAPALVGALEDEDIGVRWTAMEALIAMQRNSLRPLLQALTQRFHSVWLREGAHHILHALKAEGRLTKSELKVFDALEGLEAEMAVPWAAEKALEEMGAG